MQWKIFVYTMEQIVRCFRGNDSNQTQAIVFVSRILLWDLACWSQVKLFENSYIELILC